MCADAGLALLVFARAPIAGTAKSRLIPRLGAEGAARLQERMTRHVLANASAAGVGAVTLCCTPSLDHPFFAACGGAYGVSLRLQHGTDLGERLLHAHDWAFRSYARLLVIGTDCPILGRADLHAAAAALRRSDAVLIPAHDGGYVLLGLARPCRAVFRDIDWGSTRVFDQTLARLRESGLSCLALPPLWDVDRPQDLIRLAAHLPEMIADLPDTA